MRRPHICRACLCARELALLRYVLPTLRFAVEDALDDTNDPKHDLRNNLGDMLKLMERHRREIEKERQRKIIKR